MMDLVRVEGLDGDGGVAAWVYGAARWAVDGVFAGWQGGVEAWDLQKEDEVEAVRQNRAAVLREVGGEEMAMVRQVHSARVVRVGRGFGQGVVDGGWDGDG